MPQMMGIRDLARIRSIGNGSESAIAQVTLAKPASRQLPLKKAFEGRAPTAAHYSVAAWHTSGDCRIYSGFMQLCRACLVVANTQAYCKASALYLSWRWQIGPGVWNNSQRLLMSAYSPRSIKWLSFPGLGVGESGAALRKRRAVDAIARSR